MKIIISGGGSGGHIFPAIAIARTILKRHPQAEILFVGAEGKMEMEKVPAAGFKIVGLPIDGLQRSLNLESLRRNIRLPFLVVRSRSKVRKLLREFNPDIVIGVGGFASQPTLKNAQQMGYKTLIQEQNSFPGLTNRTLAKKALSICVAYPEMERFFPAEKILLTGNPVRPEIEYNDHTRAEGLEYFHFSSERPVVLSVGGSLGASSINKMLMANISYFVEHKVQLIWQTGKWMYEEACAAVAAQKAEEFIHVHQFIDRMDLAYAASEVVLSRAGAIAISELMLAGKPTILIPSPNVAEDHQTKNARALESKGAAMMVPDATCNPQAITRLNELLTSDKLEAMSAQARTFATPEAAERIVDQIDKLINQ